MSCSGCLTSLLWHQLLTATPNRGMNVVCLPLYSCEGTAKEHERVEILAPTLNQSCTCTCNIALTGPLPTLSLFEMAATATVVDNPELLDRILLLLEHRKSSYDFTPQRRFLPIVRVNRRWHDVAQRRLYQNIRIGSSYSARRLRILLKKDQQLAEYVRTLWLGTEDYSKNETKDHAAIIEACPNLVHLCISGWGYGGASRLVEAVTAKSLCSLDISSLGLCDREGNSRFCNFERLLELIQGWPSLRKLHLHNKAIGHAWYDPDEDEEPDFNLSLACPNLQNLFFGEGVFPMNRATMMALASIVPNVTHYKTYSLPPREIMGAWANTLRHLEIEAMLPRYTASEEWPAFDGNVVEGPRTILDKCLSQFRELETLIVSTELLTPSSLRAPAVQKLKVLNYRLDRSSQQLALLFPNIIKERNNLPALEIFDMPMADLLPDTRTELQILCTGRNIAFNDPPWSPGDDDMCYVSDEGCAPGSDDELSDSDEDSFDEDETDEDEDEEDEDESDADSEGYEEGWVWEEELENQGNLYDDEEEVDSDLPNSENSVEEGEAR